MVVHRGSIVLRTLLSLQVYVHRSVRDLMYLYVLYLCTGVCVCIIRVCVYVCA